jgi:DNA repair protein RecN (Recombination protein N)
LFGIVMNKIAPVQCQSNLLFCTFERMLQSLSIKNYAIIESIEIAFDDALNIITGETGAGKSILLGAMNLILGKRADTAVLRNKDEKCSVEAVFDVSGYELQYFFSANDLEYENETIIRREISSNGKSRAFINDSPVTLDILRELTQKLVDIHAQGETQNLLDKFFFCEILDEMSRQSPEVKQYREAYVSYRKKQQQVKQLKEEQLRMQKEFDFISFQLNELADASLNAEEAAEIENELSLLKNAEAIRKNLSEAFNLLDGSEYAALPQLLQANKQLAALSAMHTAIADMHERLSAIADEVKKVTRNIGSLSDATEYDDDRVQELSEKQTVINRLLHKHHLSGVKDLISLQAALQQQADAFTDSRDEIARLEEETASDKKSLLFTAQQISKNRSEKIKPFESKIASLLHDLGMPFGYIQLEQKQSELNPWGVDEIRLLFSANKGTAPQLLDEVGSGGEKSRLMLAIKSLVAETITLPTLIFDEIDTGISGEVAQKVGAILKTLGKRHQVIAITHLPQVAAKANRHFFVYKNNEKEKTYTSITTLNGNDRLHEIAVMLSGNNPPKEALENAKRLLN